MAEQRWTAKNDLLFKKVFASPKWRHILIGFIQDILNLDVEDVTIDNPYSIETFYKASKEENKLFYTEVDVLARLADGTLVTIEIQVNPQSYFKERALYYLADKYVSNYGREDNMTVDTKKSGAKYSALYPTYGINIVDFHLFKEDNALLHHYTLYEQELQQVLTNTENKALFNLTFFELKKHPTEKTKRHVKYWLDYFNLGKVDEEAPEYIQEASEIIAYQNLAKEEREMVDVLEKAREDYKASIEYAEEKGREEGREEAKQLLAKQLLADHMSLEIVQHYTGLDIETLKHLANEKKDK